LRDAPGIQRHRRLLRQGLVRQGEQPVGRAFQAGQSKAPVYGRHLEPLPKRPAQRKLHAKFPLRGQRRGDVHLAVADLAGIEDRRKGFAGLGAAGSQVLAGRRSQNCRAGDFPAQPPSSRRSSTIVPIPDAISEL